MPIEDLEYSEPRGKNFITNNFPTLHKHEVNVVMKLIQEKTGITWVNKTLSDDGTLQYYTDDPESIVGAFVPVQALDSDFRDTFPDCMFLVEMWFKMMCKRLRIKHYNICETFIVQSGMGVILVLGSPTSTFFHFKNCPIVIAHANRDGKVLPYVYRDFVTNR